VAPFLHTGTHPRLLDLPGGLIPPPFTHGEAYSARRVQEGALAPLINLQKISLPSRQRGRVTA
jgi:hypothetical protein